MNKFEYKNLTPFKWFVLENFPFIEADFDALTEWQLFCKLGKEINKIINSENTLGTQMENVTNAFIELENYVNNYFDNLNVQDEINNKLNKMVEDGTFENILMNYVNITKIYNTTTEMLADNNLINNQKVKTLGYYKINDGGGAEFIITNENNSLSLETANNLYAKFIIKNNTINIRQLGAKSEDDSNYSHIDIKPYIQLYLNNIMSNMIKLYIPSGIWCCSELLISRSNFNIFGDKYFNYRCSRMGTIITALNNNQRYIFKIGGNSDFSTPTQDQMLVNFTLKDIYFQSAKYNTYTSVEEYYNIDYPLTIDFASMGLLENINFGQIMGGALKILSSWEIYSNLLILRGIADFTKPKIYMDTPYTTIGTIGCNITALTLETLYFEGINGQYLYISPEANLANSKIGYINIENSFTNIGNGQIIEKSDNTTNYLSLLQIEEAEIIIDDISIQNFSLNSYKIGELIYTYNSIFYTDTNSFQIVTVNNIHISGFDNDMFIFNAKNNNYRNRFIINNFYCYSETKRLINPTKIENYQYFDIINFETFNPFNNINRNYVEKNRNYAYKSIYRLQNTLDKFIKTDNDASNPLKLIATNQKITSNYKPLLQVIKSGTNDCIIKAKGDNTKNYTLTINDGKGHSYDFTLSGTGEFTDYSLKTLNETYFNNLVFNSTLIVTDNTSYDENDNSLEIDYFIFN